MASARRDFATQVSQQHIAKDTGAQAGDKLAAMLGEHSVATGLILTEESTPDAEFQVSYVSARANSHVIAPILNFNHLRTPGALRRATWEIGSDGPPSRAASQTESLRSD